MLAIFVREDNTAAEHIIADQGGVTQDMALFAIAMGAMFSRRRESRTSEFEDEIANTTFSLGAFIQPTITRPLTLLANTIDDQYFRPIIHRLSTELAQNKS